LLYGNGGNVFAESPRPASSARNGNGHAAALHEHARWLVQLRWVAIVCVLLTVGVATALGALHRPAPLLVVAALLAAANVAFALQARGATAPAPAGHHLITTQIAVDLVALAALLHYADAARNPFAAFYVFHIAIAGVTLPWRTGARLVLLAVSLQAFVVVGAGSGLLAHHPLWVYGDAADSFWHHEMYLAGHLFGLAGLLSATLYFTSTTAARLRATEARRLEQERLARSRERLARIGTLAAGVAHGVRTPLHGILSGVDALRDKLEDDDESRQLLALIQERIEAIDGLTRTLLNLGRESPPAFEPTDLGLVLEKAARFVSTRAKERNIELSVDLAEKVEIDADADRIAEAVANLVDNAVDASPNGGCIQLRLRRLPGPPPRAHVEVEDGGSGIAPEDLPLVFDPFFTTKPLGQGSGLGLAISLRAAEEHGGDLEIRSQPGQGTVVRLDFPLNRQEA